MAIAIPFPPYIDVYFAHVELARCKIHRKFSKNDSLYMQFIYNKYFFHFILLCDAGHLLFLFIICPRLYYQRNFALVYQDASKRARAIRKFEEKLGGDTRYWVEMAEAD